MTSAGNSRTTPRLTHMGINVVNLDTMVDFYTRVMGLKISDRGVSRRLGYELVFMTSDPEVHHQVVLCGGREAGGPSAINQISFNLNSLDELKEVYDRLRGECEEIAPIDHGNAWSIYFPDPEGNLIEVYVDSPYYVPQPHGEPLDLSLPNEEIDRRTHARIEKDESFMTRDEWVTKMVDKISAGYMPCD